MFGEQPYSGNPGLIWQYDIFKLTGPPCVLDVDCDNHDENDEEPGDQTDPRSDHASLEGRAVVVAILEVVCRASDIQR